MAQVEVLIRECVKYTKQWNSDETKNWRVEAQDAMVRHSEKASEDYKRYKKANFPALEETIAINIFDITEDFSKKTYQGTSLLPYFTDEQQELTKKICRKMQEISEDKDFIEMQIIPIATRLDADLQRTEQTDVDLPKTDQTVPDSDPQKMEEQMEVEKEGLKRKEKKRNTTTGKILVFRIRSPNGSPVFLDCQQRIYSDWEDYLTRNKSPQCIMCYPKDGFLRKKETDEDGNEVKDKKGNPKYVANDLEFCESPSCKEEEPKRTLDTIPVYTSPFIVISSFHCPTTWVWTASTGLFWHNLARNVHAVCNRINRGEVDATSLMTLFSCNNLSTSIDAADACVPSSLGSVSELEFMLRLSGPQVASFAWMTWCIACKSQLKPMDIVGYTVACNNLYSCTVEPWVAQQILKKVQNEIQFLQLTAVNNYTAEVDKEVKNIKKNQAKEKRERDGKTFSIVAQETRDNAQKRENVRELQSRLIQYQRAYLENKGEWLQDEEVKIEYNEFRKNAMEDPVQLGNNTEIDQYGRIIKAVTYMDAEVFFRAVSTTRSNVRFSDDKKLDLLINSHFEIHPRAVDQMDRISLETNKNYLHRMMQLTKGRSDGILPKEEYLKEMKSLLFLFEMIEKEAIEEVKETIRAQTKDLDLIKHFAAMTPPEAYRMRTVLKNAPPRTLDVAYKMAADTDGDVSINALAAWVEVVKLEYEISHTDTTDPVALRQRYTEYHDAMRPVEIAKFIESGMTPEAAETMANANFQKRENVEEASEKRKNGKISVDDLKAVRAANKIDGKRIYDKTFVEWHRGATAEEDERKRQNAFFNPLFDPNDPTKFNKMMAELNEESESDFKIVETEKLTMAPSTAAYYHGRKHMEKALKYFNNVYKWPIPFDEEDKKQVYFKKIKNFIFDESKFKEKFISQDATYTSSLFQDKHQEPMYFGVLKCGYDAALGKDVGDPIVATHLPKGVSSTTQSTTKENFKGLNSDNQFSPGE